MSRSDPQFNLRIPLELKEYLEKEAKIQKRSVTAEILDRLEASVIMDKKIHEIHKDENSPISPSDRIAQMSVELANLAKSLKEAKRKTK